MLVDSEPLANRVLAELLSEIGLPTRYEDALRIYKGRSWATCMELVEQRLGRTPPAQLAERYRERVFSELRREPRPVPGVAEALAGISTPKCVASSSDPERLRISLASAALLEVFEGRLFSATQVPRGKPAPDLFLHAADTLGALPAQCAVIEDSVLGIEAARAAGMTPFGFAGTESADAGALAAAGARVFDDMRALPGLLDGATPG